MDHIQAKAIYEEIRKEPYYLGTNEQEKSVTCYTKGCKLISRLSELGYACRGKLANMNWVSTPIPIDILELKPKGEEDTHFFVEVLIDDIWRILDPSVDPEMQKMGFRMVGFEGNPRTCFDLVKIFSQEEQISSFKKYADPEYISAYFRSNKPFLTAFNKWLQERRNSI